MSKIDKDVKAIKVYFKAKYKTLLILRSGKKKNIHFAGGKYASDSKEEIEFIRDYAKQFPAQNVKEYDPNIVTKEIQVAVVDGKEMSLEKYRELQKK